MIFHSIIMVKKKETTVCPRHGIELIVIPTQKNDKGTFMEKLVCSYKGCDYVKRLGY